MAAEVGTFSSSWMDSGGLVRSEKRDCVFVVNPNGACGRTGKEWRRIYPDISFQLSKHYNVSEVLTSGPVHATLIARKAAKNGAAAVIAVGGDGTLYEVLNGLFENGALVTKPGDNHRTALGLIPLGTGSDFARTFGWKRDPQEAVERIVKGNKTKIDIGQLVVGEAYDHKYFISIGHVHLSAKAAFCAGLYKWLRTLSYVVGALQAFMGHKNWDLDIKIDGGEWKRYTGVTTIAVGNSQYFGGGMKITPTADPRSGDLEVTILQHFKWYHFLLHLLKLYTGSHVKLKNVEHFKVRSIEIRETEACKKPEKGELYVVADGEHVGFVPASFKVIPAALDFFC